MIYQRIERLVKLLHTKQQESARIHSQLVNAKETLDEHQVKRDELINYRREHLEQSKRLGQAKHPQAPVDNYIDFINHIDKVLVQLNVELGQLEKIKSKLELSYKEAKHAEEGIVKLIIRIKDMEQMRQKRIQLKEMNEYL